MIEVHIPNSADTVTFPDCDTCEVDQSGTLIIYRDTEGMAATAGFAPGSWAAFSINKEDYRGQG